MGYGSNCSHKPRGTSKPTFPLQRVICPQSRQSEKYRIVTHNFTNDDLADGNSPSCQYSLSTRVDLSFAVHKLAKFSVNPGKVNFEGLVHLLRYIRDNKTWA